MNSNRLVSNVLIQLVHYAVGKLPSLLENVRFVFNQRPNLFHIFGSQDERGNTEVPALDI
jgi:hypothetical protein